VVSGKIGNSDPDLLIFFTSSKQCRNQWIYPIYWHRFARLVELDVVIVPDIKLE